MNTLYAKKTIGIWGFGIVGRAALPYFSGQGADKIIILDKKNPNLADLHLIEHYQAQWILQENTVQTELFLKTCDIILPSPGIDTHLFSHHSDRFISEADIFRSEFNATIIAITGSLGKTTTAALLTSLLTHHISKTPVCLGGNIGTGMLELLGIGAPASHAVLELSSFQLEYTRAFSPELAIITNLYPNHLDRHGSMEAYALAKSNIFAQQKPDQQLILPIDLVKNKAVKIDEHKGKLNIVSLKKPEVDVQREMNYATYFYLENNSIKKKCTNQKVENIVNIKELPDITFPQNWLTITAALTCLNISLDIPWIQDQKEKLLRPPQIDPIKVVTQRHRLEKRTISGIDFYNDSKSTVMEATLAALEKLQGKPTILLLGGISKGVNRSGMIKLLEKKAELVVCFGAEANNLHQLCRENNILSYATTTLTEATALAIKHARTGWQILLSPGGASFDLFTNHQERGDVFFKLIETQ